MCEFLRIYHFQIGGLLNYWGIIQRMNSQIRKLVIRTLIFRPLKKFFETTREPLPADLPGYVAM